MAKDKIVEDPLTKLMNKIGITGIASAIFTIIIGIFIIIYDDLLWEDVRLLIGFYFLIIGLINLIGYIYSIYSQHKSEKTYIETETFKFKMKEETGEEDDQK